MTDRKCLVSSVKKLLPPGTPSESSLNEAIKATQVAHADTDERAVAAFMLNQRRFNTVALKSGLMAISRMPVT